MEIVLSGLYVLKSKYYFSLYILIIVNLVYIIIIIFLIVGLYYFQVAINLNSTF